MNWQLWASSLGDLTPSVAEFTVLEFIGGPFWGYGLKVRVLRLPLKIIMLKMKRRSYIMIIGERKNAR